LVWLAIATSFVLAMTGQARHLPRSLGFDDFAREMGVSSGRHWMTLLGKLGVGGWVVSPSAWRFPLAPQGEGIRVGLGQDASLLGPSASMTL
jgi:hypothetical protein